MTLHPIVRDDTVLFCDSSNNLVEQALTFATSKVNDITRVEPWYIDFCYDLVKSNLTPLFEWCPVDKLILIAIRTNPAFEYFTLDKIYSLAIPYHIPVGDRPW